MPGSALFPAFGSSPPQEDDQAAAQEDEGVWIRLHSLTEPLLTSHLRTVASGPKFFLSSRGGDAELQP